MSTLNQEMHKKEKTFHDYSRTSIEASLLFKKCDTILQMAENQEGKKLRHWDVP